MIEWGLWLSRMILPEHTPLSCQHGMGYCLIRGECASYLAIPFHSMKYFSVRFGYDQIQNSRVGVLLSKLPMG